jgi:hypothetical protein
MVSAPMLPASLAAGLESRRFVAAALGAALVLRLFWVALVPVSPTSDCAWYFVGRISLALLAVYPNYIAHTALTSSESLFTAALLLAVFAQIEALDRGSPSVTALAGLAFGVAALIKPQAAPVPVLVWALGRAWMPVRRPRRLVMLGILCDDGGAAVRVDGQELPGVRHRVLRVHQQRREPPDRQQSGRHREVSTPGALPG